MRSIVVLSLMATALAAPALAQVQPQAGDRYSGGAVYAAPVQQQGAAAPPARVLTWPGKSIPAAAPPQANGYAYPRYMQAQPAYGAQLQPAPYAQGRGAPPPPYADQRRAGMYPAPAQAAYYQPAPQGYAPQAQAYPQQQQMRQQQPPQQMRPTAAYPSNYQAQPYYAPAPGAPMPAPGSTATAPSGVYPANTVPPQLAYPMTVPPQMAAPLVAQPQQQPTSIYAPPQQAGPAPQATAQEPELNGSTGLSGQARPNPTDPRQPQMVAMNTAAPTQGARLYSLHREFGLTPDPTPTPAAQGQTVELVSSIDSGGSPNPDADDAPKTVKRVTDSTGKTTAQLRDASTSSDN